jgi:hypothetical protein
MRPLFPLLLIAAAALSAQTVADVRRGFENPPDDARIMMRWWWFGCAVEKSEIERELRTMREGGIGGVEVQPVYPLALDDPEIGFQNLPYLSDGFIDALRFAAEKARELGLRMDITLGSGWPFGGPHISADLAAGRLRCDRVPAPRDAASIALPDLAHGEKLIAAFLVGGDMRTFSPQNMMRVSDIEHGRLRLPRDLDGPHVVLFFISSRTGQQVKRPASGAEGFVLDHYNRAAIEQHLRIVGDRVMQAFGAHPPYAVFSDSLEVYASDWTPDLLAEFQKRRGYDLTPFLPALVGDMGPKTADIRHDWGKTLTELAEERYLTPLQEWARSHHTRFRSQTYGMPPVRLSSSALIDLPEGEGAQWHSFSTSRWAASASHLYGRPVTSSETWTWLHSPAFRATPLDMKVEADLHFLQGINQLIGHGWPYSPPSAGEPGWRFYAAAVFNHHNPWWMVMPEITKYLQRVSYILRQGKPANDVALYLPTDDAWAGFTASGRVSINQSMEVLIGPETIPRILDAGYNLDYIDDRAIESVGIPYPVLVLPAAKRMPLETARRIDEFKHKGGIVVETARLAELPRLYTPDFATGSPAIGFIHRRLGDGDVYFIANTSNQPVHAEAVVRVKGLTGEWWDPMSGRVAAAGGPNVDLDLSPYESRVLVFSKNATAVPREGVHATREILDLSAGWKVTFPGLHRSVEMQSLRSWTEDAVTQFYSGQASYEKTVRLPSAALASARRILLDFGAGTPVAPSSRRGPGMRALLEAPVREAAVVYVNGQIAGMVWHPPYRVNVSGQLRSGENAIKIVVANLAINELAGQSLPGYHLLNLRYGERFTPQDMEHLEPLPSGVLGGVRLVME